MRRNFLLLLTDDEIILHKDSSIKTYPLSEGVEYIQIELKNLLSLSPKVPLCLHIDRKHQDVREEQLPPLMLWDRLRLLSHKKEGWASQGTFYGYIFFKQEGKSFLQWINILHNDPLIPWISWIKSLSNPLCGIFFVPLEAGNFLKNYFPFSHNYTQRISKLVPTKVGKWVSSRLANPMNVVSYETKEEYLRLMHPKLIGQKVYQMLIYKTNSHNTRYVIFRGRRLLLLRPWSGEENLRTSLHFLSRVYTDIHENLHTLNLSQEISISFPNVTTLSDSHVFIDFLTCRKSRSRSLSLNVNPLLPNQWIKGVIIFIIVIFLCLIGFISYEGLNYERKAGTLLSTIKTLKDRIHIKKGLLSNKDVPLLRLALDHYNHIKPQITDPFQALQALSLALEKHHLRLEGLIWSHGQETEMEITFFMRNHQGSTLSNQFTALLLSLSQTFPNSQIHIIEAPFNSGFHETFKYPSDLPLPLARVRIVLS